MQDILLCIKLTFFQGYNSFIILPRVFSRALGCGARRGPACTPWCKCGSRPGSVARALGVQSRDRFPTSSSQPGPFKPQMLYLFYFSPLSAAVFEVPQQPSKARQPRYNSRAIPFVTATNGASACGFVSVRVCPSLFEPTAVGTRSTAVSRTEVQFHFCCSF